MVMPSTRGSIDALLDNLCSCSHHLAKPFGIWIPAGSLSLGFTFDSNILSVYGSEEYTLRNSMTFVDVKRIECNKFLFQVKHFIPHNGKRMTYFYIYHCVVSL